MNVEEEVISPELKAAAARDEDHGTRLSRAVLIMTGMQSRRTLPIILCAAAVTGIALWDEQPNERLVIWLSLVSLGALLTAMFFTDPVAKINSVDTLTLQKLLRKKFFSVALNTFVIGSGFWWLALVGSQQTILAVTLIACLYQTGAMVNASVDFHSFALGVILNLGQGVLFFSGIAGNTANPEIAISIGGVAFLLISFGRINARQFSESIRIRAENIALIAQLDKEKRTVEQALASAQEANTAKSRFLAAASHDLRQPLHALGLFLGSLSLMVEGQEARKLLRRIRETTDVLTGHFNSLLDISRFDAGGIEIERTNFNLGTVLKSATDEFRPQAESKNLTLSLNTEDWQVYSDEVLIERVVRNLLSNAVRYTDKGAVSMVAERDDDCIRVSVIDSGPGIPKAEQPHIFNEFVQLNNPARRREQGVGLGLAIVKRIDTLLDLSLLLRSSEGIGSRFEFTLPLAHAKAETKLLSSPDKDTASTFTTLPKGLNVWVLEDDTAAAEALCTQLRAWNCNVTLATTREELQEEYDISGEWPDFALVDDMLGTNESGLEIASWLSTHLSKQHIIMVTGNTMPDRLNEIAEQGFPLILKPMSSQRLLEILSG